MTPTMLLEATRITTAVYSSRATTLLIAGNFWYLNKKENTTRAEKITWNTEDKPSITQKQV